MFLFGENEGEKQCETDLDLFSTVLWTLSRYIDNVMADDRVDELIQVTNSLKEELRSVVERLEDKKG